MHVVITSMIFKSSNFFNTKNKQLYIGLFLLFVGTTYFYQQSFQDFSQKKETKNLISETEESESEIINADYILDLIWIKTEEPFNHEFKCFEDILSKIFFAKRIEFNTQCIAIFIKLCVFRI